MILTRSKTSIQLTYTAEEYNEFNDAALGLRNEIVGTLRNEVPNLHHDDKEYFETLTDELVQTLDYIDQHNDRHSHRNRDQVDL
jgi:hypothetical protein